MTNAYLQNIVTYVFVSLAFLLVDLKAQDIHHSQFYTSPINVNPALTGVFNGDVRAGVNFRNQWFVDELVDYLTMTGMIDKRFYPKKWTTKGMWSGGLLFNYDRAGDSKLNLAHLALSVSYAYPLSKNHILSIGLMGGGSQRRFNQEKLSWNEQYVGGVFNPSNPTGENFSNTSNAFFDLSAGLNYRWQKSSRTNIDIGVAGFHLNTPEQKFFSQTQKAHLPIRFNVSIMPSIKIVRHFDLLVHAMFQNQNPYSEFITGAYGKFYVSTKRGKEFALMLGAAGRLKDSFIPKLAAQWNNWYGGISYDMNTSPFKIATRRRGGPEFSLIYIFVKARPLSQLRACPIF